MIYFMNMEFMRLQCISRRAQKSYGCFMLIIYIVYSIILHYHLLSHISQTWFKGNSTLERPILDGKPSQFSPRISLKLIH